MSEEKVVQEKSDLQALLENQECIHCHNSIYSKYLERDINEYMAANRKIEKPVYLELTTITEGRIQFKGFDGYIDVCGLSDAAQSKLKKANVDASKMQSVNIDQVQEAVNQAFKDCVLDIQGFTIERTSKSGKFKRGDAIPVPNALSNHDFDEMISCIPPILKERVWQAALYLRVALDEDNSKN